MASIPTESVATSSEMPDGDTFVPRVSMAHVRNYKSIGQVTVEMSPLCIFVGANGAGKSNFLDALAFVRDSVTNSVEYAFKSRGGISAVRRKSGGHPTHTGIRLVIQISPEITADYAFEIAAKRGERFGVARERCVVHKMFDPESPYRFEVADGVFVHDIPGIRPKLSPDRLALQAASAAEEFRPVWDFLAAMRSYSIVPKVLRDVQETEADSNEILARDGGNAAGVLRELERAEPDDYERLCRLLATAVPGIRRVESRDLGRIELLQFKQDVGQKHPWTFEALNMSDGTLRLLGLLVAVYQPSSPSLLAIEEPEATVNPGITELIVQVLRDAAQRQQVLVTTHSPDLLDYKDVSDEQVRVVSATQNATTISPLADVSREAVREHLYTAGELLRKNELLPDEDAAAELANQLQLFSPPDSPALLES